MTNLCDMLYGYMFYRESRFPQMLQAIVRVKMSDQPQKLYLLSLVYVLLINPQSFALKERVIIIEGEIFTCFNFIS